MRDRRGQFCRSLLYVVAVLLAAGCKQPQPYTGPDPARADAGLDSASGAGGRAGQGSSIGTGGSGPSILSEPGSSATDSGAGADSANDLSTPPSGVDAPASSTPPVDAGCAGGTKACGSACIAMNECCTDDKPGCATCQTCNAGTCGSQPDGTSCATGMVCRQGRCDGCGASGQPCCGQACNSGLACQGGSCLVQCGGSGQPCCAGNGCDGGLSCQGGRCGCPNGLVFNGSRCVCRDGTRDCGNGRCIPGGARACCGAADCGACDVCSGDQCVARQGAVCEPNMARTQPCGKCSRGTRRDSCSTSCTWNTGTCSDPDEDVGRVTTAFERTETLTESESNFGVGGACDSGNRREAFKIEKTAGGEVGVCQSAEPSGWARVQGGGSMRVDDPTFCGVVLSMFAYGGTASCKVTITQRRVCP